MGKAPFKLRSGNKVPPFKMMGSSPVKQTESSGPSGYWSGGHYDPAGKSFEKGWYSEGLNVKHMEPAQNVSMESQKSKDVFIGGRKGRGVSTKEGDVKVRTYPHQFGTRTQRVSGDTKTITMETKNPDWAKEEGMEHPWAGKSTTSTYRRNPDATGIKDMWIQE